MSGVYYNELDPEKAEWIRELIKANVIAPGEVDERSITDVRADDLRGFRQCHFFAGIGVWSYALRLAGWPDDRPAWTGSCPCPSFSCAGKGQGFDDARHLWPSWFGLIRECRPGTAFGEQVNAAIGHGWLDLVCGDLEAEGYAIAATVLGAHSSGAPHIRQRLFFCAHTERRSAERRRYNMGEAPRDSESSTQERQRLRNDSGASSITGLSSHAAICGYTWRDGGAGAKQNTAERSKGQQELERLCATRGFWRDCDWWWGRDGKYRPIKSGLFPLAHGATARVLKLRGAGDAICPEVAKVFIEAAWEAMREAR